MEEIATFLVGLDVTAGEKWRFAAAAPGIALLLRHRGFSIRCEVIWIDRLFFFFFYFLFSNCLCACGG